MSKSVRVSVLIPKDEADSFDAYCHQRGYKKSTLIARLVRDHLKAEGFVRQPDLFRNGRAENKGT